VRARCLALAAALWIGAAACQGMGIPKQEIPDEAIAILYRTPEQAQRRAEALEEREENPELSREGVAPVDEVARYLKGLFGAPQLEKPGFHGRLALLDPRSGAIRVVESTLPGAIPQDWSADHQRLLFAQRVGTRFQLFELDRRTDEVRQLTRGPNIHPRGCYGPDGSLALMAIDTRVRPARLAILLTDPEGGKARRISWASVAHSPACAPDGSAVAYVTTLAGGAEQIVAHAPPLTGEARVIAPGREPTFSPDGRWIVYSGPARDEWKLRRIRPDGTGRAPIGRGVLDEMRPAVSPDGRLVAYVVESGVRPWLYLRRLNGTGDRILFSGGDADHPTW
jgi:TolB protein